MTTFEKILLATQQIQNMAVTIENVRQTVQSQLAYIKDQGEHRLFLEGMLKDEEAVLDDALTDLCDIVEGLENYKDSTDLISGVDVALSKVPLDILNGFKTANDFEEDSVCYASQTKNVD